MGKTQAMKNIEGQVAIVTGSSRGIGEAIARRLALAGAKVVVSARTVEVRDERLPGTVHSVTDAIKAAGGEATAIAANMQKAEDRQALFDQAVAAYGQVDIIVNNAAILVPGAVLDYPERYYGRMMEILINAPFHLSQLALPGMIERGQGAILNISSSAARHPKPQARSYDGAVYGMCKAAVERLTTGLASEMYEHGIAVNALSPESFIATPGQMFGRKYTQEMIDSAQPVEGIAEAAYLLVADRRRNATGGIRYTEEVLTEYGVTATDIGMAQPEPN